MVLAAPPPILDGFTMVLFLGFLVCGLVTGIVSKMSKKLIITGSFVVISWLANNPMYSIMFVVGIICGSLSTEYFFGQKKEEKPEKDWIRI
jgi:hypothetical protein